MKSDRAAPAGKPPATEDEIEVTPEMIAAGVDAAFGATESTVARVYRAMEFARQAQSVGKKLGTVEFPIHPEIWEAALRKADGADGTGIEPWRLEQIVRAVLCAQERVLAAAEGDAHKLAP